MFPDSTTLAPVRSARIINRPANVGSSNLVRTAWLIGTYDPAKTGVDTDVPTEYLNANAIGDALGWGFPLHRQAIKFAKNGAGIKLMVTPQAEASGATASTRDLTVTAVSALAGTASIRVGGDLVQVSTVASASASDIALAIKDAVNADAALPVTADNIEGVVTLTSKAKGWYGSQISVTVSAGTGEALPQGVAIAVGLVSGGTGDPDIQDALDGIGTGDGSNNIYATDVSHSYEPTSAMLAKLSNYNGPGDQTVGCWSPVVGKPFRVVNVSGDTYNGIKSLTDGDLKDRTNAIVAIPGCDAHPSELAAEIVGAVASINQATPHESYVSVPLSGICDADVWTNDGASRDLAIKAGISTTRVINNELVLDGMVTLYRPATVATNNNAYRSFRNISILQNILKSHRDVWASKPSFTIVEDVATVNPADKRKVLDIEGVKDINMLMLLDWQKRALIFESADAIANQEVELRSANNGFDIRLPIVLSGEGIVSDTIIYTDINLAVYNK